MAGHGTPGHGTPCPYLRVGVLAAMESLVTIAIATSIDTQPYGWLVCTDAGRSERWRT